MISFLFDYCNGQNSHLMVVAHLNYLFFNTILNTLFSHLQVRQRAAECSRLLDILTDIDKGTSVRNFLGFHFTLKQFKVNIT